MFSHRAIIPGCEKSEGILGKAEVQKSGVVKEEEKPEMMCNIGRGATLMEQHAAGA